MKSIFWVSEYQSVSFQIYWTCEIEFKVLLYYKKSKISCNERIEFEDAFWIGNQFEIRNRNRLRHSLYIQYSALNSFPAKIFKSQACLVLLDQANSQTSPHTRNFTKLRQQHKCRYETTSRSIRHHGLKSMLALVLRVLIQPSTRPNSRKSMKFVD